MIDVVELTRALNKRRGNGELLSKSEVALALAEAALRTPRPVDPDTGKPISGWGIDHDRSHPPE